MVFLIFQSIIKQWVPACPNFLSCLQAWHFMAKSPNKLDCLAFSQLKGTTHLIPSICQIFQHIISATSFKVLTSGIFEE